MVSDFVVGSYVPSSKNQKTKSDTTHLTRSPPHVGWRVTITGRSWRPWPSTMGSLRVASCGSAAARRAGIWPPWLARELTPVTLRELSAAFGLTHPDSVAAQPDSPGRSRPPWLPFAP